MQVSLSTKFPFPTDTVFCETLRVTKTELFPNELLNYRIACFIEIINMAFCDTIVLHFQIVCLSILSVPTLCLKDPQTRNDIINLEILPMVGVNKVAWVSAIQKQDELYINY